MGYKASLITVKPFSGELNNEELLSKLGFPDFRFANDTTLEECMYPRDKSINIGSYNDSLIISDDYQLTEKLELSANPENLIDYEQILSELFPGSEILTVACHSAVNYHLYSLIKDGKKVRFKKITTDTPLIEYGHRIQEEERAYGYSKIIDGKRKFKSTYNDDDIFDMNEDQLMEDFTFGVAKRHLGVMISWDEGDELEFETPFKRYIDNHHTSEKPAKKKEAVPPFTKRSWFAKLFNRK